MWICLISLAMLRCGSTSLFLILSIPLKRSNCLYFTFEELFVWVCLLMSNYRHYRLEKRNVAPGITRSNEQKLVNL